MVIPKTVVPKMLSSKQVLQGKSLRLWLRAFMLRILIVVAIAGAIQLSTASALAAPQNLAKQPLINVEVRLGDADGSLQFYPNTLAFEAGRRYQLHLVNDSPTKHYFTAKDFADGVWNQKVDTGGVEVKGAIHEIEVRPGAYADWVFVPVRAGNYPLRCVVPGHTEAGMVGSIQVEGQ